MASVAIMVGAAIVNAIAFMAGNALYDKYGRGDEAEERLKHKATEELQKASVEWNKKRSEQLDWINSKLREKNVARAVFDDVDKALDFYNETYSDGQVIIPERPKLENFYQPSVEQHYYQVFIATVGGLAIGYTTYKLLPNQ